MKTQKAYSVEEAATLMGVCRAIAFEEIRKGRLPARKIGRRTVVVSEDLDAYLRALPVREVSAQNAA
jgi:excisionase family DNA binding protein